jgi:tyrosine-protein phosphatase non-receptor type 4
MGEDVEEPEFQYVPDTPHVSPLVPGTQALSQSMLLLEESLDSGAVVGQFEQLYRRNTGLAMTVCHSADNLAKNRYRDISPYDSTRVMLGECPSGDYINANHVVMTIPGSGIINRYLILIKIQQKQVCSAHSLLKKKLKYFFYFLKFSILPSLLYF